MKYSTKSAQYYRYFEDAKIIEMDNENKKMAIVFNGKDDLIDIFDASPYVDYNPFKYVTKEDQNQMNKKKRGTVYIEDNGNNLDVNQIYEDITTYKNNATQNSNQINHSESKHPLFEAQKKSSFDKYMIQRQKKEMPAFSRMISIMNKGNKDIHKEKENQNNIQILKRYNSDLLYISKFIVFYESPTSEEKINICIKKPRIQHRLLSVIHLNNDSVVGMKWFSFSNKESKKILRSMSEKEKYILRSKMILVVSQEGCVSIYKLVDYDPLQITKVNLKLQNLQTQPFWNCKEKYSVVASVKLSNPVLDFNLLDKSLEKDVQDSIRLITLHINNSFTFWYIINQGDKIELRIQFNFNLTDFKCENFLMDTREEYLICFNKKGINIYLSKGQNFPYPVVYRYTFNDILPSLDELKKIIYTNDVINEDEEERKEKKRELKKIREEKEEEEETKKEKKRNKKNKKKLIKENNMDSDEDKELKKGKNKEAKKKKENKKKKEKEKEEKKIEKNNKKSGKKKKEETEEEEDNDNVFDGLIKFIKKKVNRKEEEEGEEDEDEMEEDDDFIVEGNPDFINKDIDIFYDDDKYLKFLQKPFFLSSETKFLFVNYEVKSNQYSLYCFDFFELYQVEENKNFLETCLNNYVPNLITKIYTSKEKLYLYESPFYYFNPNQESSIDNNLLSTINGRKILMDQKIEFKTILDNTYHGLFIRDGDYIIIIKLPINQSPYLELINNDINSTKYLFYDQPTSENLKSNRFAIWTLNNTLLVNSVDSLFNIIKFRNEANILGIAINKRKVVEYFNIYYNS